MNPTNPNTFGDDTNLTGFERGILGINRSVWDVSCSSSIMPVPPPPHFRQTPRTITNKVYNYYYDRMMMEARLIMSMATTKKMMQG
jgi:hypothetical protein